MVMTAMPTTKATPTTSMATGAKVAVESDADRRAFLNLAEFGKEALYTAPGVEARPIAILDDWQALDLMADDSAGVEADSLTVLALAADVPDFSRAALLALGGVTYRVAAGKPDGTGFILLSLVEV